MPTSMAFIMPSVISTLPPRYSSATARTVRLSTWLFWVVATMRLAKVTAPSAVGPVVVQQGAAGRLDHADALAGPRVGGRGDDQVVLRAGPGR